MDYYLPSNAITIIYSYMGYYTEFKLVSTKKIFQYDACIEEELKLYNEALYCFEPPVDDFRELFLPFMGTSIRFLNTEYGVDELVVEKWLWIINQTEYEIVNIYSWLRFDAIGAMGIRKKGDTSYLEFATFRYEEIHYNDDISFEHSDIFKSRIKFFDYLQLNLDSEFKALEHEPEITTQIINFRQSSNGILAIHMNKFKHVLYRIQYDPIINEHCRLQNIYLDEFTLHQSEICCYINFVNGQLHYRTIPKDSWININGCIDFFTWKFEGQDYKLIHTHDLIEPRCHQVFLLKHENGPIKSPLSVIEIFRDWYITDINQHSNTIIELRKRVYSVYKFIERKDIENPKKRKLWMKFPPSTIPVIQHIIPPDIPPVTPPITPPILPILPILPIISSLNNTI